MPDRLLRSQIRRILARDGIPVFLEALRARSLADEAAIAPPDEVPAAFFANVLGPRMKYSCGLWDSASDLSAADDAMLELVCERAGIEDGMSILDVGAGWGALTFWLTTRYPSSFVCAVTRSIAQGDFIHVRAPQRRPGIVIAIFDARTVTFDHTFDRVVALEMIEHTGNPEAMLARMRPWLKPGGRVFVQAIAHRSRAAVYALPWFERGTILSDPLIDSFETGLTTAGRWTVDGVHYRRTLEAWRARLESHRHEAAAALGSMRAYRRWRAFLIACEEMFGWEGGRAFRVVQRLYSDGDFAANARI